MIFVGGVVTVEGNGTQPVDVQTAVFGPEDARIKAVRAGDAGEADLFVTVEPVAGSKSSSSKVASPSSSSMSGSGISRPCSSNADRTEAV